MSTTSPWLASPPTGNGNPVGRRNHVANRSATAVASRSSETTTIRVVGVNEKVSSGAAVYETGAGMMPLNTGSSVPAA